MRKEYNFSKSKGVRGKYYKEYTKEDLWWRIGMDVYFQLPMLTIDSEAMFSKLKGKGGPAPLWDVHGFKFKIMDEDSQYWDVMSEQLWAVQEGLA